MESVLELIHHYEIDHVLPLVCKGDASHRCVLLDCDVGVSDCWVRVHNCKILLSRGGAGSRRYKFWLARPKALFIVLADCLQLFCRRLSRLTHIVANVQL